MVTNLILVCMMCGCNMYVIPRSVSRKDLDYKCPGSEPMQNDTGMAYFFSDIFLKFYDTIT